MGTNTLDKTGIEEGEDIESSHVSDLYDALTGTIVGRDSNGVPAVVDLGDTSTPFNDVHANRIVSTDLDNKLSDIEGKIPDLTSLEGKVRTNERGVSNNGRNIEQNRQNTASQVTTIGAISARVTINADKITALEGRSPSGGGATTLTKTYTKHQLSGGIGTVSGLFPQSPTLSNADFEIYKRCSYLILVLTKDTQARRLTSSNYGAGATACLLYTSDAADE